MQKIKSVVSWFLKDKKRIVAGVLILGVVIFGIVKLTSKKAGQAQYQTAQVTKGTIVSSVSASGQILTSNTVDIGTNASGVVNKVYVKDGDVVKTGQTLATLTLDTDGAQKSSQAYASYLSATNSLANANNQLYSLQSSEFTANQKFINDAVARGLATTDPTYIEENDAWLAAQASYVNQQNVIAQAQIALNNASESYQADSPTITAPTGGTLENLTITPGMVLASSGSSSSSSTSTSSQRIAVIKTQGNPIGTFNVSEIDVSNIQPGQIATITLDSIPNKTFTGKVMNVDRIGTVSSGVTNYPINILFDTSVDQILPNMSATANVIVATKDNVLLVPTTAIQTQNSQDVVRVLNGSQVQSVTVTTGLSSDTETEIDSGLTEGQTIITGSVFSTTTTGQSSIFSSLGRTSGAAGGAAARAIGR
jgi:multidrug efflux pump subunit AcrA (membrane-fusion protein)